MTLRMPTPVLMMFTCRKVLICLLKKNYFRKLLQEEAKETSEINCHLNNTSNLYQVWLSRNLKRMWKKQTSLKFLSVRCSSKRVQNTIQLRITKRWLSSNTRQCRDFKSLEVKELLRNKNKSTNWKMETITMKKISI